MIRYFLGFFFLCVFFLEFTMADGSEGGFEKSSPVKITDSDLREPGTLSDSAAAALKGLCSIENFQSLPAGQRHVYSFDPWPFADDQTRQGAAAFNFHFGNGKPAGEKILFSPAGGGPKSKASLTRVKGADGGYQLEGFGNLDWGGKMQLRFRFDKPLRAFGIVLESTGDVALRRFYWPAARERNGYPVTYTLSDGTVVNVGQRDVLGATIPGGERSFVGVEDSTGRGIVSVNFALGGLAGNVAQKIAIRQIAFATKPVGQNASVLALRGSHDFDASDEMALPSPMPAGLASPDEFRFIVPNKRFVYRFDPWPAANTGTEAGAISAEFDLGNRGQSDEKMTIRARSSEGSPQPAPASLRDHDGLPYPVLGGLGLIGKNSWQEHTFTFSSPVSAFGVTYCADQEVRLAPLPGEKSAPVSCRFPDGAEIGIGGHDGPPIRMRAGGKTFVGIIDKTDKGITSVTVRLRGTSLRKTPLFIEEVVFAKSGPPPGDWKLVLSDEFDGDRLDPRIWSPGYVFKDVINNEYQGYVPENISVANGVCTIKVEKRDCYNYDRDGNRGPAQKFSSGAFTSYGKFTPTYGYFEARVRMPKAPGAGVWPAFWMLPDRGKEYPKKIRSTYRTEQYGTGLEIDIFEFMPRWKRQDGLFPIHMGCIWSYGKVTDEDPAPHGYGSYALDNDGWGPGELVLPNLDSEFHTYGLYWSPERLIFFIDGRPVFRVRDPKHIPDVPHYFLFNVALSGNGWGKSPDKSHPKMEDIIRDLPNALEIDYFRAYSGTLDEAIPANASDDPSMVRSYSPPPAGNEERASAPSPESSPRPAPDGAPAAPVNSAIESPAN